MKCLNKTCYKQRARKSNGEYYVHCEICRKNQKRSYEKNKNKYLEHNKQYYVENKDQKLKYQKKYNAENKERLVKYQKQYHNDRPGFKTWEGINNRCYNSNTENYKYYGAKDIKNEFEYTPEWIEWLFKDIFCGCCGIQLSDEKLCKSKRTIDRIDNNGNYNYENCATICLQCNQKKSKGIQIYNKEIIK